MDALVGGRMFTGSEMLDDAAILLEGGRIAQVVGADEVPGHARRFDLAGGLLAPGFIDLQVNGGGGVLFNDAPSVATLETIGRAHRRTGTTGFLPTLITTDADAMRAAITAVRAALDTGVPGVLGIHLEGPHLNPARCGVHRPERMRPLDSAGLELLASLGAGRTLVTLAPECVTPAQIRALVGRGVVVSAGHTDASFEQLADGFAAGITGVTHLYNAMSQLGSRAPGAVGAALAHPEVWCGIVVDGHHVHPGAVRVAWRAKLRGKLFLVSDAMPPVGTGMASFVLDGRRIGVRDGRATTEDGRLAGALLDMAGAMRNAVRLAGIPLPDALAMTSTWPAEFLGVAEERGHIAPGLAADLVLLGEDLDVRATWIAGRVEWA